MQHDISAQINAAISSLNKGNLPKADIICRILLDKGVRHSAIYEILGHISYRVKRYDMALHYFQCAIDIDPSSHSAINSSTEVRRAFEQERHEKHSRDSYLLIKAWGCGFWSDVDHVLGMLLLAEITGRIPVVYWSSASLFSDGSNRNSFEIYFQPLSVISVDDLIGTEFSYFPPKWSANNLKQDKLNKYTGIYSRMAGLYYLNRAEDILVSDFHTAVNDLMHWIPVGHYLYGKDCESIYRYLFKKYLRINANIHAEIRIFSEEKFAGRDCVAVHVRGSDKQRENRDLAEINASYSKVIEEYLLREPELTIFLLTDSKASFDEFSARYPGRIVSTQCARTDSNKGVHYEFQDNKVRNGIEVVKDAYLAAECKYFIGNGYSNVSTSILHMKDWQEDHYTLVAKNHLYEASLFLHNW